MKLQDKLEEFKSNYYSRDNAVQAYHTILNHHESIEFESEVDQKQFQRDLSSLKESILIQDKELFSQKFATSLLAIIIFLKKGHY